MVGRGGGGMWAKEGGCVCQEQDELRTWLTLECNPNMKQLSSTQWLPDLRTSEAKQSNNVLAPREPRAEDPEVGGESVGGRCGCRCSTRNGDTYNAPACNFKVRQFVIKTAKLSAR